MRPGTDVSGEPALAALPEPTNGSTCDRAQLGIGLERLEARHGTRPTSRWR